MKTSTKLQLSKLAIRLIIISAAYLICAAVFFLFNNFVDDFIPHRVEDLVGILSVYAGCIAVVAGILCACLNLGIIAEHTLGKEEATAPAKSHVVRWFTIGFLALIVIACIVFFGIRSISKSKSVVDLKTQTEFLVKTYQKNIDELPLMLADTARLEQVFDLLSVMSKQQRAISDAMLIFQDTVNGLPVLISFSSWESSAESVIEYGLEDSQYTCDSDDECQFLLSVFSGDKLGEPVCCTDYGYGEDYYFYPFEKHGRRFVLRFGKNTLFE